MKQIHIFATALCLVGCASTMTPSNSDYIAAARLALGKSRTEVIVVGPEVSSAAKSALAALGRTVVEPSAIQRTEKTLHIPNYVFLKKFEILAEEAVFESIAGVVASSSEGAKIGTCGVGAEILMSRKSGAWVEVTTKVSVCSSH